MSRLRFGLEQGYERLSTATGGRRGVAGVDATLRFGIISALREERCSEFCLVKPWVDIGPVIGLGLAFTSDVDMIGHAMGGGWFDIRLSPASSYPVLRFELQRDAYSSHVEGNTQFVVALGIVDWDIETSRDD